MLRALKIWLGYSFKLKLLAFVVYVLLSAMQLGLAVIPFRWLARWLLKPQRRRYQASGKAQRYAGVIGRMIARMAHYTPWPAKCLAQGLVCRLLFRQLRIPSVVFLGVAEDDSAQFIAHCWVNFAQTTILGGSDSPAKFKIITQFEDL